VEMKRRTQKRMTGGVIQAPNTKLQAPNPGVVSNEFVSSPTSRR
jgi:hypothetical protein